MNSSDRVNVVITQNGESIIHALTAIVKDDFDVLARRVVKELTQLQEAKYGDSDRK